MTVSSMLQLAVLPLSAGVVLVLPPAVMAHRSRWSVWAVVAWALAVLLLAAWVVSGYRSGVAADENGAEGDIYDGLAWLLDAVLAAGASVPLTVLPVPRTGRVRRVWTPSGMRDRT